MSKQLKPLEDRMTDAQLVRRAKKIQRHAIRKAQIIGQINVLGQYISNFIRMPFYRRWLWVLIGPRALR